MLPLVWRGAAAETKPVVAGGEGSTSWYGNVAGRDVVGEIGGLGTATASTECGDGWFVAATSFASAAFFASTASAFFTPSDAAFTGVPAAHHIPAETLRWQRGRAHGASPQLAAIAITPCSTGTTPPWDTALCIPGPGTMQAAHCRTQLQHGGGGGGVMGATAGTPVAAVEPCRRASNTTTRVATVAASMACPSAVVCRPGRRGSVC
jgi:hypothetical protein